ARPGIGIKAKRSTTSAPAHCNLARPGIGIKAKPLSRSTSQPAAKNRECSASPLYSSFRYSRLSFRSHPCLFPPRLQGPIPQPPPERGSFRGMTAVQDDLQAVAVGILEVERPVR